MKMALINGPNLQGVSWDLHFGACHFCSFVNANLADITPKLPVNIIFCEINSIKIVYLFLFSQLRVQYNPFH